MDTRTATIIESLRGMLALPMQPQAHSSAAVRDALDTLAKLQGYSTVAHIWDGREYMDVNAAGWIARKGQNSLTASPGWRLLGAVELNNFGATVRNYSLAELLADPAGIPWTFKNGKPRVRLCDFDHGTRRQWCRPAYVIRARHDDAHVAATAWPPHWQSIAGTLADALAAVYPLVPFDGGHADEITKGAALAQSRNALASWHRATDARA